MMEDFFEAAVLLKRWLYDRNEGHNNDDGHSWAIEDFIARIEATHGHISMNDWREEQLKERENGTS